MQARTEIVPNGALIARTRILAGMNKTDVARKAGVPHSSIIRAEQGRGVTPKTALGISRPWEWPLMTCLPSKPLTERERTAGKQNNCVQLGHITEEVTQWQHYQGCEMQKA